MAKKGKQGKSRRRDGDAPPEIVETASRLHSAALHLMRRVSREDTSLGLSPARLSALSVLVFGGARTIGQLAAAERVTPPTMTRLVAALEAEGLVVRSGDPGDRRTSRIAATEQGERILRRGREQRVKVLADALGRLGDRERGTMAEAAELIEALLRDEPPHR